MSETSISYVTHSGSPWTVCAPVTEGCAKCFARTQALRRGWCKAWGPGVPRRAFKTYRERMLALERWAINNLQCLVCKATGDEINENGYCRQCEVEAYPQEPSVLFDLGDWLDDEVPPEMLASALDVVRLTPHVNHFWPTKRPENFKTLTNQAYDKSVYSRRLNGSFRRWLLDWRGGTPPKNFLPGVSVSVQPDADQFVPDLLRIPALRHWVSVEPMLGPVSLFKWFWDYGMERRWAKKAGERIDLVVIGCESSGSHLGRLSLFNQSQPPNKRADEAKWWGWAIALVRECKAAGVPVHVKQIPLNGKLSHNPADGWPEDLNVRETI